MADTNGGGGITTSITATTAPGIAATAANEARKVELEAVASVTEAKTWLPRIWLWLAMKTIATVTWGYLSDFTYAIGKALKTKATSVGARTFSIRGFAIPYRTVGIVALCAAIALGVGMCTHHISQLIVHKPAERKIDLDFLLGRGTPPTQAVAIPAPAAVPVDPAPAPAPTAASKPAAPAASPAEPPAAPASAAPVSPPLALAPAPVVAPEAAKAKAAPPETAKKPVAKKRKPKPAAPKCTPIIFGYC